MVASATDVFVSYKVEDRARLKPLVEGLEAEGFSVWWDAHIGGGTNWHEDIEQHLDAAKCVVVAWSKRSVGHEGHFVRDEARRAQRRDAYIPVCLDQVEPPLGFGEIQALSLKGWRGARADPRFQAVANAIRNHISGTHVVHTHVTYRQPRVSRRVAIAGGAGVAALAAGGGWLLLGPTAANAKRIAVLPFANLSGTKEQDYFADGIAEELRGALSRIGMEVIGRASSDAVKDLDTKTAASKLGVANILTGSVRRSPQTVRISAQLVGGNDGVEHWAQSYDRAPGDEIKIQTDIATNVAQALSVALGQARRVALVLGGTADAAAQDLFLRAGTLFVTTADKESDQQALALVEAATARDPKYAEAYRLKARILSDLTIYAENASDLADMLAQAELAAKRSLAIEPRLGSAYATLAGLEADQFKFPIALQNMRQALALSPGDVGVLSSSAIFAEYFGDPDKALRLADRLVALDPLAPSSYVRRAEALFVLRDYPRSIVASRRELELAPQRDNARRSIANCLVLMDRLAEAKAEYASVTADDPLKLTGEAILAARSRDLAGAERIMVHMRQLFGEAASYQYAQIYAQAGDANRAFAEFDNAVRARDPGLQSLKSDPFLDPIRRDPRYAALLKRLNFPTWN